MALAGSRIRNAIAAAQNIAANATGWATRVNNALGALRDNLGTAAEKDAGTTGAGKLLEIGAGGNIDYRVLPAATHDADGAVRLARTTDDSDANWKANNRDAVTPAGLVAAFPQLIPATAQASETARGVVELATLEETTAGVSRDRAVTPYGLLKSDYRVLAWTRVSANGAAQGKGVTSVVRRSNVGGQAKGTYRVNIATANRPVATHWFCPVATLVGTGRERRWHIRIGAVGAGYFEVETTEENNVGNWHSFNAWLIGAI